MDTARVELAQIQPVDGAHWRRVTALQDINFRVHAGAFVAVLGPSGCGTSTLLRLSTGLQRPTDGHGRSRGAPMRGINPHTTIVFQTLALLPWLTVQQNVEVALRAHGMPATAGARRAEACLDQVGLDGFETAFPRELSGGMRPTGGVARALAVEPELRCLDAPFSALEVLSADARRGEWLELWTGGAMPPKAILLVTHNIEEAVW